MEEEEEGAAPCDGAGYGQEGGQPGTVAAMGRNEENEREHSRDGGQIGWSAG
jgi:hypothetical protein